MWDWALAILSQEALPGVWNTVLLTQVVLVGTGLFTLVFFGAVCRHFVRTRVSRGLANYFLIVMRTTPEYILAYVFLQLWGPSMLPPSSPSPAQRRHPVALTGQNANLVKLEIDAAKKRANRYLSRSCRACTGSSWPSCSTAGR